MSNTKTGLIPAMLRHPRAESLLEEARETLIARQKYDKHGEEGDERTMPTVVQYFNVLTGRPFKDFMTEDQGYCFMQCLKLARIARSIEAGQEFDRDSFVDLLAYTALRGEVAGR